MEIKCSSFAFCDLFRVVVCSPYVRMTLSVAFQIRVLILSAMFVVVKSFFSSPHACLACWILCVAESPFLFCMLICFPSMVDVLVVLISLYGGGEVCVSVFSPFCVC